MKGVILAGGTGSRLSPVTRAINKHLLPVYDRPMVHYPMQCLANAGIDDVLIVTGAESVDAFERVLGDGRELGVGRLAFAAQPRAGGIAEALALAEPFAAGGPVCVVLGDNIIERNIRDAAARFADQPTGAKVVLARGGDLADLADLGVVRFAGEPGRSAIAEIVEKPHDPPSDYAAIGIYFYHADVFDACRGLTPSARGELEITGVNNHYARRGELTYDLLDGWWADAGTFEALHAAADRIRQGGANHTGP